MPKHTPINDFIGKRYTRLIITEVFAGVKTQNKTRECKVVCDCGKEKIISLSNIVSGRTKSCGCLNRESATKNHTTHNLSKSRIYHTYMSMINRCSESAQPEDIKIYFDNGVKVCDEWLADFMNFYNWSLSNGYKDSLTIDRYPNQKGNYEPGNCRWVNATAQVRNREVTLWVVYKGESRVLAELAEEVGITYSVLWKRLFLYGYTIEEAIAKPIKRRVVQNMA